MKMNLKQTRKSRKDNRHPHHQRRLSLESLEGRRLMAADLSSLSTFDMSQFDNSIAKYDDTSSMLARTPIDTTQFETARKDQATNPRAQSWFEGLSPAVRSAVENGRDLSRFSKSELTKATSWAVITDDSSHAKDLVSGLARNALVQNHTDMFGGTLPASVYEVQLKNARDYQQLTALIGKTGVFDVIPLFSQRDEATGTLDPATVADGSFANQWHLDTTASPTQWGIDAEGAWASSTGQGVTVAIVDTRQQFNHPDLIGNNNAALNYDDANRDWDGDGIGDNNPNVFLSGGHVNWPINGGGPNQSHGTAVAGIAIGDDDGTGIVGVAPDATYAAFNYLESPTQSIANTFSAANIAPIDVFNNSWGVNNWRELRVRSFLDLQAVQNAATNSIFVKSAGNNRDVFQTFNGWDRTNYDPFHMRQAIMVAAAQQNGGVEAYSNPGSNNLISAPVNRSGFGNTWTSDVSDVIANAADNRGYANGNLATGFNGTSAAAPMVSGVVALMLEVNPNLDWREIQHILIDTAQKNGLIDSDADGILDSGDGNSDGVIDNFNLRNTFAGNANYDTDGNGFVDPYHTGWFQNAAGNWVSDDFGFGMLDANSAVQAAADWDPIDPELHQNSLKRTVNVQVNEGFLGGLNSVSNVSSYVTDSHLQVEWVEITVNATVPVVDDLMLVLQSPGGTQSVLMAPGGSTANANISNFTFSTNQFWDESAEGIWRLQALDTGVGDGQLMTIDDWKISIHGKSNGASPLQVVSLDDPSLSPEVFTVLAMAGGGMKPDQYELIDVRQVGDSLSMGVFMNGSNSGLPMNSGLLFTSGKVVDAIGPNDRPDTRTDWNNPGHELLDDLTGKATNDASGLEIIFSPNEDVWLSFDHLFGSEEFDEYVGSQYNDGAGIFLAKMKLPSDEPSFDDFIPDAQNIVETFSGITPTVNNLAGVDANGNVSGKDYDPNHICGDMNWEYDGSSVLATSGVQLTSGSIYYVGMVVADASDGIYDSALAISLDPVLNMPVAENGNGEIGSDIPSSTHEFPFEDIVDTTLSGQELVYDEAKELRVMASSENDFEIADFNGVAMKVDGSRFKANVTPQQTFRSDKTWVNDGYFMKGDTLVQSATDGINRIEVAGSRWKNFVNPYDVNNDGSTTVLDALNVINELGRGTYADLDSGQLPRPADCAEWPELYYDTTGDDRASALDALMVINEIARSSNSSVEAELTDAAIQTWDVEMDSIAITDCPREQEMLVARKSSRLNSAADASHDVTESIHANTSGVGETTESKSDRAELIDAALLSLLAE
ncbi:MAG: S8 family serine peptidase [Rubripirellula sp.]|nr:S8 family serine peptidase [Rubripirellula sp.]